MTPDLVRYLMQFNNTTKPIISFMPQNPRRPALSPFPVRTGCSRATPTHGSAHEQQQQQQQQRQCSPPRRRFACSRSHYKFIVPLPCQPTNQPTNRQTNQTKPTPYVTRKTRSSLTPAPLVAVFGFVPPTQPEPSQGGRWGRGTTLTPNECGRPQITQSYRDLPCSHPFS
jgi:hypothetical protein